MPELCAKAFSPTMALERCTTIPLMRETTRLVFTISRVLRLCGFSPAAKPKASGRVESAMAHSSMAVLPARSPIPLMVPSTWRAPACTAAKELATQNIRVNAVAPGIVKTERFAELYESDGDKIDARIQRIALGRLGTPEDVAHACAFLASDRANYISGQILGVDGCASI